ncbi:LytTR family DNA-binding domain-containing protein [Bizionia paragorgiae]|jgi:two-component system, LytTR family, response regulator|uniref:Two component transcriptional regulator, LytTR family n=1 Tax=Bizionia paragorgiae TaxID=283786 RepID=A0A1H4AVL2_BIZPA|nr:LytTR family DNA-binding domain-containing protein [Bizionia paragorgiae]MDX1270717.1 LytTR family DNA-binding domain-containing protein [Bizionia paragorgiae]SEA39880.1 two component transcriptional regulator, LytTR family [Bizionia paragorgiae]
MLKAVIVDDEPKAIEGLSWELKNYSNDIEIIKTFSVPEEALTYLKKVTPDCLFLDIQMPTMDGFQFLEQLDSKNIAIIITSAYDEYAIRALKKEALDYLLKPIDADDLKETILKIRKYKTRVSTTDKLEDILINFTNTNNKKKITINTDGKLLFLDLEDILFVESDGNYSTLFLANNQKLVVTKKLKEVNLLLPEESFFRIHNSFIVNMGKIKEYIKTEGYVIMESNHKIPVARQRKSDFLEKL